MGTAGDRTGYKVFSINTTIRNPARNYDFLKVFERFDGIENTIGTSWSDIILIIKYIIIVC